MTAGTGEVAMIRSVQEGRYGCVDVSFSSNLPLSTVPGFGDCHGLRTLEQTGYTQAPFIATPGYHRRLARAVIKRSKAKSCHNSSQ